MFLGWIVTIASQTGKSAKTRFPAMQVSRCWQSALADWSLEVLSGWAKNRPQSRPLRHSWEEITPPRLIRYGASEPLKELLQTQVKGVGDLLKRPDADFLMPVFQF